MDDKEFSDVLDGEFEGDDEFGHTYEVRLTTLEDIKPRFSRQFKSEPVSTPVSEMKQWLLQKESNAVDFGDLLLFSKNGNVHGGYQPTYKYHDYGSIKDMNDDFIEDYF